MDTKLTVTELARIVGLPKRTIRYYDEIGLFKSSGTFENGYRYYTIDKIEEIFLIQYMRHIGIPIKEIKKHQKNHNIDEYNNILNNQLERVNEELVRLQRIQYRIQRRLSSLDYIRSLPTIGEIFIQDMPSRRILSLEKQIEKQMDWEVALREVDENNGILPNIFIGDVGFFVDLNQIGKRKGEDFTGLFLLADDPIYDSSARASMLPKGRWLSLYIRGDHHDANHMYQSILDYAGTKNLKLASYAVERTLLDHYISSDPNLHITEILVPIED